MYRWDGGSALVQTVDFFTPIVDDPYAYGQIAAANALSDVYAMGGRPLTALAIAAFPKEGIDRETIATVLKGGYDKLVEAGVALLGGHTVQDPEIKFGYAVTGAIEVNRVLTNSGAKPGDALILTKPLGTGIVATAMKGDRLEPRLAEEATRSMRSLNRAAADGLRGLPGGAVHACTDVTGFGLIGHSTEMAVASHVVLRIESQHVPVFDGVTAIASANRSGGLTANELHFGIGVRFHSSVSPELISVLFDPQTSGGLLIAVAPQAADEACQVMTAAGASAWRVGDVREAADFRVEVVG